MKLIYWAKMDILWLKTEASLVAMKEVGLGVNTEKIKYVFMSREQNAGQNHNIETANTFIL
jgi:hypothetical protein